MSDDKARFGLELIDKMSGPAERIVGGLESATGALDKLGAKSDGASGGMTKMARAAEIMTVALRGLQIVGAAVDLARAFGGMDALRSGALRAGQAVKRFGVWAAQGLKRVAPYAAGGAGLYGLGKIASAVTVPALGAAAMGIGAVSLAAAGGALAVGYLGIKLAGLAISGTKAAAEFAVFGQNSRLAFDALAKHGASGTKIFNHARGLADELGLGVQSTVENYKKLLAGGFAPKLADDITKMGADMRFLGAGADEVKGAVRAITQIKAAGRLQGDELNQLAEAGIGASGVYQALGKRLGKTTAEVMKLKEAGKIDSTLAIASILDAVKEKTGSSELGERGKEWANSTVAGFASRIKSKGENLMIDLGDRLLPSLQRLTHGAFQWVEGFVQSGRAEDVVRSIGRTFDAVGSTLVKIQPLVGRFLDGFGTESVKAFDGIAVAVGALGGSDGAVAATSMEQMGRGLANIVIYGGAAAAAMGALTAAVAVGAQGAFDSFFALPIAAAKLGLDVALGIARGLRDGVVWVVDAITGLAESAINAFKGRMDMRSPSRLFREFGGYTAEGYALGVYANAGLASDATAAMADGAARAAEASPMALARAGSSASVPELSAAGLGGALFHFELTQNIDGSGLDANEVAKVSARETRREIDAWFRGLQIEGA